MEEPPTIKAYLATRAGQFHLRSCGAGRPLLLLHQSPSSGDMWMAVMPHLARAGFHVMAPDLPGFGESFTPRQAPLLGEYAAWIMDLLDALEWPQADLMGHHTGAAVALKIAALAPGRVHRIVAWGVPLMDEAMRTRLANEALPELDDGGAGIAAYWARRRALSGNAYSATLGMRRAVDMLQTGMTLPWGHWAVAKEDMAALLRKVTQPTLTICGQTDPVWERSREAAATLYRGEFACIEGAGLDVVDEFPQIFSRLAVDFLGR